MMKRCIFLCCALIGGCMVGPNYEAPDVAIADDWQNPDAPSSISEEPPASKWWELFEDPLLCKYIDRAAQANEQILAAEARICEARAMRQVAASALFPQVSADLNAMKTYFSKNGPVYSATPGQMSSSTNILPFNVQAPQIQNLFNALFDASWEIDLFGKTRRAVEGASAVADRAIDEKNDILLSVFAELARNYLELCSARKQTSLVETNLALLEKTAFLIKERLKYGYSNQLDLDRVEAELSSLKSQLPELYAIAYRNTYAIAVLTGSMPETLVDELASVKELPRLPSSIAIGLKSDLLRRRPDVRAAERTLAAATAYIGVAVASFYPSFVMSGGAGFQSLQLKDLFQSSSKTWAYGGNFNIPVFEGGKLVGYLEAARASACAAAHTYQQTILSALQDAETALALFTEARASSSNLSESASQYRHLAWLSQIRHQKGLVGLLDVLDSDRQFVRSQIDLLASDTKAFIDLIALYKSLGGGWEVF